MKSDKDFYNDRLKLFESPGWLDLVEELNNMEISVRNIDTMNDDKDLWHAKGQLQQLGFILSLENATKIAVENLDS